MEASSRLEIQQAHVELWNLTFSYLKSMALECAVQLNIPNVIHNLGGSASLENLLSTIPVPEHRRPYLPRLLRFLKVSGILASDSPTTGEGMYHLTPLSRLLVGDTHTNGCGSLAPFVLSQTTKYHISSSMYLSEWFKGKDGVGDMAAEMPFKMAHGTDPWGALGRDPQFNTIFNAGLGSNSQLVLDFVVAQYAEVFDGISSLIDVGGGNGSTARTISKAFPHVKCSVLDLPNVIADIQPTNGMVEYIAGDMFTSIPPTDVVLLKYVLHDWNDDDCVKILDQCKKAICSRKLTGGKVIIIDTVIGSPLKEMFEAQVTSDLLMMVIAGGKERDKHEWHKIFMESGFKDYKMKPVLGFLSIIELYL